MHRPRTLDLGGRAWLVPLLLALLATALVLPRPAAAQQTGDPLPASVETAVRAAAASEANVSASSVVILRAEAVTWNNGCMGVETPGTACTQALVDGYVVWVEAGNTVYRYHTDTGSGVVLAESGIAASSVASAPLPSGATARDAATDVVSGEVPASGIALLVTTQAATPAQVIASLQAHGCNPVSIAVTSGGSFISYVPGAPAFVNAGFPTSLAASTAFATLCGASTGDGGGAYSTQAVDQTGRTGNGVLTDVRVASHAGFDRIVFEFGDELDNVTLAEGVPSYRVSFVSSAADCGSGAAVNPAGTHILEVHFPDSYSYDPNAGTPTVPSYHITQDYQAILEVDSTCAFEGQSTWAIGLDGQRPFRISELSTPTRLVIDVQTS